MKNYHSSIHHAKRRFRVRHHSRRHGPLLRFVDGLEGGFAIFAGIVAGLSFTVFDRQALIATALIGITVNAVNAATIRYSSEHYIDELDGREKRSAWRAYFVPAVIEFVIYMAVSFLSLLPLLLIDRLSLAIATMIALCVVILFVAGLFRGLVLRTHSVRDGLEIMTGGIIMIVVGAIAGWLLTHLW